MTPDPPRSEELPDVPPDPSDPTTDRSADGPAARLRRRSPRRGASDEGEESAETIARRFAQQWVALREERRLGTPVPIVVGPTNTARAQVPWGVDVAAAWGWRLLVIGVAGYVVFRIIGFFSVVTLPLAVALLFSALVSPLVALMVRIGLPRGLAAILVVLGGIAFVAALLTFAGQQVASGASDLAESAAKGLGEIRTWLTDGPLHATDSQINDYLQQAQDAIRSQSEEGQVVTQLTEVGTALGHVVAGFFIVLFSTYFFLADGHRIWAWVVRLAPRAARQRFDSSGRVAWVSLVQFVRATVIVAAVDAAGIMIGAAALQVPFVLAIGVLVFLGAFVPMIGATIAGTVAVLVALVDQGPVTAVLMLGVVILVQQLEGHVLQPFLMGRWVSVHPLGVILAIAAGVLVAGIAGALVAVPLAAAANAVVQHLAAQTDPGEDPVEALEDDYDDDVGRADPVPASTPTSTPTSSPAPADPGESAEGRS